MELSGPRSFSELVGQPVRDQSGRRIGRVFEARGHRQPDGAIVLDELIIGRGALLKRLRGPGRGAHGIQWDAVVEIGDDGIVIHA